MSQSTSNQSSQLPLTSSQFLQLLNDVGEMNTLDLNFFNDDVFASELPVVRASDGMSAVTFDDDAQLVEFAREFESAQATQHGGEVPAEIQHVERGELNIYKNYSKI